MSNDNRVVYSVGADKQLRAWKFDPDTFVSSEELSDVQGILLKSIDWTSGFSAIDHHYTKPTEIATSCGQTIDVWDVFMSNSPIQSYQWGEESVLSCKYHPSETNLVGTTISDNAIGLFDLRASAGIQKVFLKNRSNNISWNPRDPFIFAVANDDGNVYEMDMRRVGRPDKEGVVSPHSRTPIVRMHTGHVQGVLDVEFSPLGTELVSGGYDKTVRIFELQSQKSREIYHTKRMQRVLAVKFTGDGRFVLSGSEDSNIRVWKAVANERLGSIDNREKRAIEYRNKLKEKFEHTDEIGRILHNRRVPKWIKNEGKRRADHFESRRIAHNNKAVAGGKPKKHALEQPVARVEQ